MGMLDNKESRLVGFGVLVALLVMVLGYSMVKKTSSVSDSSEVKKSAPIVNDNKSVVSER